MTDPFYPHDWPTIAASIKAACNWCCMACGVQCRMPGEPYDGPHRTLTVAHYDGDYESDAIYVIALCAHCHLRHDAQHVWRARRRWQHHRRMLAGQMTLALDNSHLISLSSTKPQNSLQ